MNNDRSIVVKPEGKFEFSPALEQLAATIAKSTIIPKEFQNNPANCLIALELASRIGAGVLATMQSLYIVHGKPAWSGQFIIGAINNTRRFSQLRFQFNTDKTECYAYAEDREGNGLIGPTVSIAMAKAQGWYANNNKWRDMSELMLMYRSGTFFGRVFCPDILLGMREQYEVLEAEAVEIKEPKIPTHTKDMIAETAVRGGGESRPDTTEPAVPPPEQQPVFEVTTTATRAKGGTGGAAAAATGVETKPEPEPKTRKKKLSLKSEPKQKAEPASASSSNKIGPNRAELKTRLAVGNYSEEEFLALANYHEWLGKGRLWETMDAVPDDMFAVFLLPDEWTTVMEQLEKTIVRKPEPSPFDR